jgi:protein TonB
VPPAAASASAVAVAPPPKAQSISRREAPKVARQKATAAPPAVAAARATAHAASDVRPGAGDAVASFAGIGAGPGNAFGLGGGRAAGVEGDSSGSAVGTYLSRVRQRLEAEKRYPLLARRRGVVGTATLHIVIGRDGRPASIDLQRSSGSDLLDAEAEALVSRAAPFGPLPPAIGADTLQITVPIRFDVDG